MIPSGRWSVIFCAHWMVVASIAAAEDKAGSVALKKWEESVATYIELRDEQKAIVIRSLEVQEREAEQASDADLLMEIRTEKENFMAHGWLPTLVNTATYEKKLAAGQKALTQSAQRTSAALSRAKLAADAAKVDKEAAALTAKAVNRDTSPMRVVAWRDPRVAWGTKINRNVFQLLKSGDWRESVDDSNKTVHLWQEVNRTPQAIELYDIDRGFRMKLMATEAQVDYAYNPKTGPQYGKWNDGRWFDPVKEKSALP